MAEIVQLLIPGPPSPCDPLGRRWLADDDRMPPHTPEWVDAVVVAHNPDGTLDLRVGEPRKGGRVVTASEGDAVGQFRRLGSISHTRLRALRSAVGSLMSDPNPALRKAAETVRAIVQADRRADAIDDLAQAATNTKLDPVSRVQALTLLGVLLAQEVDR